MAVAAVCLVLTELVKSRCELAHARRLHLNLISRPVAIGCMLERQFINRLEDLLQVYFVK